MPDVIEQARTTITNRIAELENELDTLRRALRSLGDGRGRHPARRRAAKKPPGRTRTSRNGQRRLGRRQQQFLAAVRKNPGARVSEISRSIGIASQQGHGIANSLTQRGQLRKKGKGYTVKE